MQSLPSTRGLFFKHWSLCVCSGQRDAVPEASYLAGEVLRHHQSARDGEEHDRGAVHHSGTIAAGRALQQGEAGRDFWDTHLTVRGEAVDSKTIVESM